LCEQAEAIVAAVRQHFLDEELEILPLVQQHFSVEEQRVLMYQSLRAMPLRLLEQVRVSVDGLWGY
jgi:zinc finger-like protein